MSPTLQGASNGDALHCSPHISLSRSHISGYLILVVCSLVFIVYLPALTSQATFHDDEQYVLKNGLVQNPSWLSVKTFFGEVLRPSTVGGYYQPLTMTSLMFDCLLSRPPHNPALFHRTSLLLHVANTALVAMVLTILFHDPLAGAITALFFGLHPMTVDSVCWLSERKTVLATFFALSSLAFYLLSVRRTRRAYFVSALVLYTLALLSKPTTVPVPAVMILMDYWPLRRLCWRTILAKTPFLVMACLFAVITLISQERSAGLALPGANDVRFFPLALSHDVVFYPSKILWPTGLSPYYYQNFMTFNASNHVVLTNLVVALVLVAVVLISLRWTRALFTGFTLFFVAAFPTMGLVRFTEVLVANRFAYLPSLGFLMIVASFMTMLRPRTHVSRNAAFRWGILMALVPAMALLEATMTRRYVRHWRDTESLYRLMITTTPDAPSLYGDFGTILLSQGRVAKAKEYYIRALQLNPGLTETRNNLAMLLYTNEHKVSEAITQLTAVLRMAPDFFYGRYNLGCICLLEGSFDQAVSHLKIAVEAYPYYSEGRHNLAWALLGQENSREAVVELRAILQLMPKFIPAMTHLAWLLATHPDADIRRADEAVQLAEQARAMTRGRDVGALDALAAAHAMRGDYRKAAETAQGALAIAERLRDYDFAKEIEERLRLYQYECPYYENPRVALNSLMAKAKNKNQVGDDLPAPGPAKSKIADNSHDAAHHELQTERWEWEVQDDAETIPAE